MLVEHRSLNAGVVLPAVSCTCTAISVTLAGRYLAPGDGAPRSAVAVQPGFASIMPLGFEEAEVEIGARVENVHIFLAPSVTGHSALYDYDADPSKAEVVRYKGMSDPLLKEIASSLLGVVSRPPEASDKLFVEGASAMLAAHLVSKYSNIAQRRAAQRLRRPFHTIS